MVGRQTVRMALDPNSMTPQEYLAHLNAEAERRSREQAAELLAARGMVRGDEPVAQHQPPPSHEAAGPAVRASAPSPDRVDTTTSVDTTVDASRSGTVISPTVSRAAGDSGPNWTGRIVWGAIAAGVGVVWPAVGQLLAGNWVTFFALLFAGDVVEGWVRDLAVDLQLDLGGQDPWQLVVYLLAARAFLSVLTWKHEPDESDESVGQE